MKRFHLSPAISLLLSLSLAAGILIGDTASLFGSVVDAKSHATRPHGKGVGLGRSVRFSGGVVVGSKLRIEDGVVIGDITSVTADVVVGDGVQVKRGVVIGDLTGVYGASRR